jgi:hypothetical protein
VITPPLVKFRDAFQRWKAEPDPYIRFSVLLYPFVFAAIIHIMITPGAQRMQVLEKPVALGYAIWETIGLIAPALYLCGWLLRIYHHDYAGKSLRLVADILLSTVMWSVWSARINADFPFADVNIFTNYVFFAVCSFTLFLVGRDVWMLFFRKDP